MEKWALASRRFWGLLATTVGTLLPLLGSLVGLEIDPVEWAKFSADGMDAIDKLFSAISALLVLGGQVVAWWGAWRAKKPLTLGKPTVPVSVILVALLLPPMLGGCWWPGQGSSDDGTKVEWIDAVQRFVVSKCGYSPYVTKLAVLFEAMYSTGGVVPAAAMAGEKICAAWTAQSASRMHTLLPQPFIVDGVPMDGFRVKDDPPVAVPDPN